MPGATGPPTDMIDKAVPDVDSILSETAAPTLLLDSNLRIVFFTPATTTLVNMLEVDLGRPLADLCITGFGEQAAEQAADVLTNGVPLEHDLTTQDQRRYRRRTMPFEALGWSRPGVLITFLDHTAEQLVAGELANARQEIASEQSNHLNALSNLSQDLRLPLQTLKLLQTLLSEALHDTSTLQLNAQIGETLSVMSGTINAMFENTSTAAKWIVDYRNLAGRQGAIDSIETLTTRQRQIMDMVLAGQASKNIAAELGISQRTVENHRASIMTKTHSRSIPALARLALRATPSSVEEP